MRSIITIKRVSSVPVLTNGPRLPCVLYRCDGSVDSTVAARPLAAVGGCFALRGLRGPRGLWGAGAVSATTEPHRHRGIFFFKRHRKADDKGRHVACIILLSQSLSVHCQIPKKHCHPNQPRAAASTQVPERDCIDDDHVVLEKLQCRSLTNYFVYTLINLFGRSFHYHTG